MNVIKSTLKALDVFSRKDGLAVCPLWADGTHSPPRDEELKVLILIRKLETGYTPLTPIILRPVNNDLAVAAH